MICLLVQFQELFVLFTNPGNSGRLYTWLQKSFNRTFNYSLIGSRSDVLGSKLNHVPIKMDHILLLFWLFSWIFIRAQNSLVWTIQKEIALYQAYPKDPQKVLYPLATLKCSHILTSWTCTDFLKLKYILGQVVIQSKKSPHKSNSLRRESNSKLPGGMAQFVCL